MCAHARNGHECHMTPALPHAVIGQVPDWEQALGRSSIESPR